MNRCLPLVTLLLASTLMAGEPLFKPTGRYASTVSSSDVDLHQCLVCPNKWLGDRTVCAVCETPLGSTVQPPEKETPKVEAQRTRTISVVQHAHRCNHDGTVWWHGAENNGNIAAHTCPKCGRQQYQQTGQTRTVAVQVPVAKAKVASIPVFKSQSSCPGGVCPTQRRR